MEVENILTVPGRYDQIRKITEFVTAGGRAAGLHDDALFHVELCCDEASTNIIEHAYGGEGQGTITVKFHSSDGAFNVVLCDHGQPFDPKLVPEPQSADHPDISSNGALTEFLDNLQVGGLGVHFMRRLMDEVHYHFDPDEGNVLTLVKYIPGGSVE